MGKYSKYIVNNPKVVEGLPYHSKGRYRVLVDGETIPGGSLFIVGGTKVGHVGVEFMDPHTHDAEEAYILLGEKGAIEAEVDLGGEKYKVASPGAAYIPKGVKHSLKFLKFDGHGCIVVVLGKGSYP